MPCTLKDAAQATSRVFDAFDAIENYRNLPGLPKLVADTAAQLAELATGLNNRDILTVLDAYPLEAAIALPPRPEGSKSSLDNWLGAVSLYFEAIRKYGSTNAFDAVEAAEARKTKGFTRRETLWGAVYSATVGNKKIGVKAARAALASSKTADTFIDRLNSGVRGKAISNKSDKSEGSQQDKAASDTTTSEESDTTATAEESDKSPQEIAEGLAKSYLAYCAKYGLNADAIFAAAK